MYDVRNFYLLIGSLITTSNTSMYFLNRKFPSGFLRRFSFSRSFIGHISGRDHLYSLVWCKKKWEWPSHENTKETGVLGRHLIFFQRSYITLVSSAHRCDKKKTSRVVKRVMCCFSLVPTTCGNTWRSA